MKRAVKGVGGRITKGPFYLMREGKNPPLNLHICYKWFSKGLLEHKCTVQTRRVIIFLTTALICLCCVWGFGGLHMSGQNEGVTTEPHGSN